jgi:hypothetical protein
MPGLAPQALQALASKPNHRRKGGPGVLHQIESWLAPITRYLTHLGVPHQVAPFAAGGLVVVCVLIALRILAAVTGL